MSLIACDKEVFNKGLPVLMLASIPSEEIEAWVVQVRTLSGQRVDWSFFAGRAIIRVIGDISRVRDAITELWPLIEKAWAETEYSGKLPHQHLGLDD